MSVSSSNLPDGGAPQLPDAKLTRVFALGIALWLVATVVCAVALLLDTQWAANALRVSAAGAALGFLGYWWAMRRERAN